MGLFDIFKSKPKGAAAAAAPADKNVARYARTASDRHAQNYDRMEALESLAKISSAESAAVLLKRFTFYIEPSITDQEEKEVAFQGIVGAGEAAIDPIVAFCADPKSESLTWPLNWNWLPSRSRSMSRSSTSSATRRISNSSVIPRPRSRSRRASWSSTASTR